AIQMGFERSMRGGIIMARPCTEGVNSPYAAHA
ncbi:MAG: hypothetical protein JWN85_2575, partial [Gammaproteobacteria bacterium]|nr:hypothetical protein [Gammaproteobacteria bacterium]